jgi:hypothetical protein
MIRIGLCQYTLNVEYVASAAVVLTKLTSVVGRREPCIQRRGKIERDESPRHAN